VLSPAVAADTLAGQDIECSFPLRVTVHAPDGRCHPVKDEPRTITTRRADTRRSGFRVARLLGGFRDCASLRADAPGGRILMDGNGDTNDVTQALAVFASWREVLVIGGQSRTRPVLGYTLCSEFRVSRTVEWIPRLRFASRGKTAFALRFARNDGTVVGLDSATALRAE
jgi:hypothetical protein